MQDVPRSTQNAEDETTGHEITLAHMAHTVSGGKISIGASSEGRPDVIPRRRPGALKRHSTDWHWGREDRLHFPPMV